MRWPVFQIGTRGPSYIIGTRGLAYINPKRNASLRSLVVFLQFHAETEQEKFVKRQPFLAQLADILSEVGKWISLMAVCLSMSSLSFSDGPR